MEPLIDFFWLLCDAVAKYFTPEGATRRWVMLGATLLGISSGVIGVFAFLRKQSLLSDAMAHAALPGICIAFMLTGVKDPLLFLLGASATGLLGALLVGVITKYSRIKDDTAIGLVLSVFFAMGIVLLTIIEKKFTGNKAGLDSFLFGKAALLVRYDIYIMALMCLFLLLITFLFYKEFKIVTFDVNFAISLGLPVYYLDLFITLLIVLSVMVGLQAVGVVLMVAMLIFPAAAARQWTNRLGVMIAIAAFIGGFSGAVGSFCSVLASKIPTGPVMVLVCSIMLIISIFFAPNRGLVPKWIRISKNQKRIQRENILKSCYKICESEENWEKVITINNFLIYFRFSQAKAKSWLNTLTKENFLCRQDKGWQLTSAGLSFAREIIRRHRLWELYLTQKLDIADDHVHRDADDVEHVLSGEIISELEKMLDSPLTDPHGRPIPSETQVQEES